MQESEIDDIIINASAPLLLIHPLLRFYIAPYAIARRCAGAGVHREY